MKTFRKKLSIVSALAIGSLLVTNCGGSYEAEVRKKANRHFENKEYKEAVNNFTKLMDIGEENFEIIFKTAKAYTKMGNNNSALDLLKKASRLEPENPEVQFYLGKVYQAKKYPGIAKQFYATAGAKGDNELKARSMIARARIDWGGKDFDPAIEKRLKKAQTTGNKADFYPALNRYYIKHEKFAKAITNAQAGLKLEANNAERKARLNQQLAIAHRKQDKYDDALKYAFKAVQIDPENSKLAMLYYNIGEAKKKYEETQKAEAEAPAAQ